MKIKRIIRIIWVIFHDIISHIVYCVEEEEKEHKNEKTNTTINFMWTGVQRLSLGGKIMDIMCLTIVCCVAIMAVTTIYCVEINAERKYNDED